MKNRFATTHEDAAHKKPMAIWQQNAIIAVIPIFVAIALFANMFD